MFLFYVLSITLCLSSVSTCVCVIFNPIGTFRTIATYLFYALILSILLTSLSIAPITLYFDNRVSEPESLRFSDGKTRLDDHFHHDTSASQQEEEEEVTDTKPIHPDDDDDDSSSSAAATQKKLEISKLTEEAFYKVSAPLFSHEDEQLRTTATSPVVETQTMTRVRGPSHHTGCAYR